jgi:hypothetical protein
MKQEAEAKAAAAVTAEATEEDGWGANSLEPDEVSDEAMNTDEDSGEQNEEDDGDDGDDDDDDDEYDDEEQEYDFEDLGIFSDEDE